MPVVLRAGRFAIHIYHPPREHPPPHGHLRRSGGGEVVIVLGSDQRPPYVLRKLGLPDRDLVRAMRIVLLHQDILAVKWRQLHEALDTD